MARAAAKPKTTAAKPAAKPHAATAPAAAPTPPEHVPAAGDDAAADGVPQDSANKEDMDLAGFENPDGTLTAEGAALLDEHPQPAPAYAGPISPTPPHLIRMTHPTGGVSDGFATDESGAILVPVPQVEAMKGHGFVVDHLPQPEAEAEEA